MPRPKQQNLITCSAVQRKHSHLRKIPLKILMTKLSFRRDNRTSHLLIKTFEFVSPYVSRTTKTLSLFQEFVIVLIKLRLNVPNLDLAYRFEVSLSTVSRVFKAWMEVLDVRLSPLISWPEREELWRKMPRCLQYTFGKATTIIIVASKFPSIDLQICWQEPRHILIIRATTLLRFLLG